MAIQFTAGMTATTSADPIRVTIIHNPSEGYILSYDGDTITEEMSLRDFLKRLLHNLNASDIELRRREDEIMTAIRTNNHSRIHQIIQMLDSRYSTLIKNKQLVLAQHNYSIQSRGIVSESISNNERTITQSSSMTQPEKKSSNKYDSPLWDQEKFRQEMENQGFKMSDGSSLRIADSGKGVDNDIYYLLTTPS